ncbi:MAG: hypothetical protein JSW28_06060, partial [Thermoplasmata archaeon]
KKAILRPNVAQSTPPLQDFSLSWQINDYRKRYLKRAVWLIILQLVLIPVSIWHVSEWGTDEGLVIYYYPVILAGVLSMTQFWMPSKIAFTNEGVFIKKKGTVTGHKYEDIERISLSMRGIRIGYRGGVTKSIDFITPSTATRIITAMEQYKASLGVQTKAFSGATDIGWRTNRAYTYYQRLFFTPILAVGSATIILIALIFFSVVDMFLASLIILMFAVFLVFLIYPWIPLRWAPKEVGFSSEGLHCRYAERERTRALLRWVAWTDITEMDLDSGPEEYIGGPVLRARKNRNYAHIQKSTGARYLLGPVDDEILGELRLRQKR